MSDKDHVPHQSELDGFEAYSKSPVVPFAPLHRELGVSYVEEIGTRELNDDRQKKIFDWVVGIAQPFDMIQRAEGWTTPERVYFGGQNRAVRNNDQGPIDRAVSYGKAGRAAIQRHFRTTNDHYDIASDRFEAGQQILSKLGKGRQLNDTDAKMLNEILQELANGIAANLDDSFPGGDEWARLAGNSVLKTIDGIACEGSVPTEFTTLISASTNYALKQKRAWKKALDSTERFAIDRHIVLSREAPDVTLEKPATEK